MLVIQLKKETNSQCFQNFGKSNVENLAILLAIKVDFTNTKDLNLFVYSI